MWRILFVVVLLSPERLPDIDVFVNRFIEKYQCDEVLRPTDTLLFVPTIMNLSRFPAFKKRDIHARRQNLFKWLSTQKLFLVYPTAIDIQKAEAHHNPRGDLDYWERKRSQPVVLSNCSNEHYDNRYRLKIRTLSNYCRTEGVNYCFIINELDGIDFDLLWAIKNEHLYAIEYYESGMLKVYDAQEYVNYIAPDLVFSSMLRAEKFLSE